MPTCQKCGSYFPNRIKIEGVTHVLGNRKMCLECSPWKNHNTRSFENLSLGEQELYRCSKCKKDLPKQYFYWGQNRCSYCKDCDLARKIKDARELKIKALDYNGTSCVLCGETGCPDILDFHHLNPETKVFGISHYRLFNEEFRKELDKCVVLCGNCHAEVHGGFAKLPEFF